MRNVKLKSIVSTIGIVFLCLNLSIAFGQNIAITDDDSYTANSSAMLDIKSLTKGLLIPRLTQAQRDVISSPAIGLMIYQTDNTPGIYYFDGTWKMLGVSSGDNLGNHVASQNIQLNNNWLSNDGDNEGIFVDNNGYVGIGISNPSNELQIHSTAAGTFTHISNSLTGTTNLDGLLVGVNASNGGEALILNREKTNMFFYTDNTQRLTIDSIGKVGIGINTPTQLFQLGDGIGAEYALFHTSPATAYMGGILLTNADNSDAGSTSFKITSSYNGTGATSGTMKMGFVNNADKETFQNGGSSILIQNGTGDVTIAEGIGKVGIGTPTPFAKLHVFGDAIIGNSGFNWNTTEGILQLAIRQPWHFGQVGTGGSASLTLHPTVDGTGFFIQSADQGWDYAFGVTPKNDNSTSSVIMLPNGGNVGIGTSTPTSKLDVIGTAANVSLDHNSLATANFRIPGQVQLAINSYGSSPYTTTLQAKHTTLDGYAYPIALNPLGGNVGIGTTTPAFKLSVVGGSAGISVSGGNDGDRLLEFKTDRPWYFEQEGDDAGTHLRLREYAEGSKSFYVDASGAFGVRSQDGSNYKFLVNSLGNIGIGTATPTARLDIKGGANVADSILFSVKDKDGNNVFIVYPDAVQVIVPTDPLKDSKTSKRGAFVVSGRGATKGETNFMDMTKENYLIGHSVAPNISGTKNTIIGYEAANSLEDASNNIMIGYQAGQLGTSASNNVFIGNQAGKKTTDATAERNVFIGHLTGGGNTTGKYNTFLGSMSGYINTTGNYNSYVGTYAGNTNSTGSYNVCVGYYAGGTTNNISYNTLVGYEAGMYSDANYNTFIGSGAGRNSQGYACVFIGRDAGKEEDNDYKLYIDNSSTSSPLIYGDFNTNYIRINGDLQYTGTLTDVSDKRLKKDLIKLEKSVDNLSKINGFYYFWKTKEYPDMVLSNERQIGVVAQEVEEIYPELVKTDEKGYKSVDYIKFTPILIEAIKEQQQQLEQKDKEIKQLNDRLLAIEEYLQSQK